MKTCVSLVGGEWGKFTAWDCESLTNNFFHLFKNVLGAIHVNGDLHLESTLMVHMERWHGCIQMVNMPQKMVTFYLLFFLLLLRAALLWMISFR